ncbi:UDP-glucose 4-epimerase GalE [Cytobacillus dafuensis]|uniref:UDP-glucose 4-epimerase n=1 Tax=Cytobacillus dafuensis TaxID=1742359 RepID=A0A5B8Z7M7_CYTDA|nr:UDP-glucose 4-epimerase GalE [Cytobacillus dafuensis]QED48233.1 UDP-glucose 4-epimerase GalE [Cytobacillus dafuensis]
MAILVTGGAGYIGSHTVYFLLKQGLEVIVIDNLQTGHLKAVHPNAKFYEGDIRSPKFLEDVFSKERIEAVFHFAASSLVGESIKEPLKYYDTNVCGTLNLLESMGRFGINFLVFSSSAAVYGKAKVLPIIESSPLHPTNPYGETKLAMERMIKWWGNAYGTHYVSLRYFNAAGAMGTGDIGEDHTPETHLIPIVLQTALGKRDSVTIFGDNFSTKDGTCIRDYIHVEDLAEAHLLALNYLQHGGENNVFNLGSKIGYSVREVIKTAVEVTGENIHVIIGERRKGDPAELVASSEKAEKILGWKPKKMMNQIIKDAWEWHQRYPEGYNDKRYSIVRPTKTHTN